ncbi:LacI family transcriptional regulator [Saccharopolyspora rhizosphaerae]|uniref:LacI family transcriptional regulator n=1 Tax=Saccharopolyspora rhizosphaerae TaxID=2492662 RepID=A0A426K4W7_9PSEU|nr:LacI family DNA-binding transcriptional regulator [Saccharopolyspora rhizosphaerae]RRO20448.1 LacI family transcriptional regulator [Saccharopolyspora rhizosphaerae]
MAPTLTDVAKRADVALSTASRAFSDPQRLGPQTLRKVLSAAQELGYHAAAKGGDDQVAGSTVAMVVPDIANPVYGTLVKAAQGEGRRRRQTLVLHDTDRDPDREREAISHLRSQVAAIVLCSSRLPADELVELCGSTPSVLINQEHDEVDCVLADAGDGLRQAVDYLAALGHARIAFVSGSTHSWSSPRRVQLVEEITAAAGIELDVLAWQAETVAAGTAVAASVLATGASAVITHNDLVALGVIKGARALGVEVPDGLSVIGIDDVALTEVSRPSLTSISIPWSKAGALSVELLGPILGGHRPPPRKHLLPAQLVVRDSTAPASR